ncbi:MAG: polysaccharide biosynthesis tyrosine autokinase [Solobacterium sp.]|nr:polysaccharide biosynthesis tyrosine autokinase [Solobacterium sp.]
MSEKRNMDFFDRIEPYSLISDLLRSLWAIIAGALAAAMITILVTRANTTQLYTSSATFAIMSKTTASYAYNNLNAAKSAASSFTSILNSEVLKKRVCEDVGLNTFSATAEAAVVKETNLLTLTVTSDSPQKTYRIIRSIMKNYPYFMQYTGTNMVMEVLAQPKVPLRTITVDNALSRAKRSFVYTFVGLLLLFAYLSIRHDTIKTDRDLKEKLDATALGSIEHEVLRKTRKDKAKASVLVSDVTASFSYVEKYKKIAASVIKSAERHHARIIVITSVAEHEGKSTVAANLALTMQTQHKKALLVDCDMRRPSQAKIFGMNVQKGTELTDLLSGDTPLTPAVLYREKNTRLPMILCGTGKKDSTEYLKDGSFADLMEKLRDAAEYIILDTPPMSLMADAEAIANCADISILVVQYNRTLSADVNDAIDELKKCRAHMSGCILNDVRILPGTDRLTAGSRYGYGNYGRYGRYGKYGKYGNYGHYAERRKPAAAADEPAPEAPEEEKPVVEMYTDEIPTVSTDTEEIEKADTEE